jgi:hypothetical protein
MFGQRFKLKTATIATAEGPDTRIAVQLPIGAEIVVRDQVDSDGPADPTRQVNVEWDGKMLSMFLVDIREKGEWVRAEEVGSPTTVAQFKRH